jgi:hypothetical protein
MHSQWRKHVRLCITCIHVFLGKSFEFLISFPVFTILEIYLDYTQSDMLSPLRIHQQQTSLSTRKVTSLDKKHNFRTNFGNMNKGNNKITELRTILQRESQNSQVYKQTKSVNNRKTVKTAMTLTWYRHF